MLNQLSFFFSGQFTLFWRELWYVANYAFFVLFLSLKLASVLSYYAFPSLFQCAAACWGWLKCARWTVSSLWCTLWQWFTWQMCSVGWWRAAVWSVVLVDGPGTGCSCMWADFKGEPCPALAQYSFRRQHQLVHWGGMCLPPLLYQVEISGEFACFWRLPTSWPHLELILQEGPHLKLTTFVPPHSSPLLTIWRVWPPFFATEPSPEYWIAANWEVSIPSFFYKRFKQVPYIQHKHAGILIVNCPTIWSLLFIFGFLCWSSIFPIPDTKKYSIVLC